MAADAYPSSPEEGGRDIGGAGQAALFRMALEQSNKAWGCTPMLSRISRARAVESLRVFSRGNAADIGRQLSDMAGSAFAAYSIHNSSFCAQRAQALGCIVIQMLADEVHRQRDGFDVPVGDGDGTAAPDLKPALERSAAVLALMQNAVLAWVEHGRDDGSALAQVDQLIDRKAAIRLSLVAPFAAPLAQAQILVRALDHGVPLAQPVAVQENN